MAVSEYKGIGAQHKSMAVPGPWAKADSTLRWSQVQGPLDPKPNMFFSYRSFIKKQTFRSEASPWSKTNVGDQMSMVESFRV
jgi:hypothetical protein